MAKAGILRGVVEEVVLEKIFLCATLQRNGCKIEGAKAVGKLTVK
uniref:Uncharacterized protein n=1 Tax=Candidozyma auris TaxID=498019 RepID=A0A0L0NZY4_CANAR